MNYEQLYFVALTIDFTATDIQFNLRAAFFCQLVCHTIEQLDFAGEILIKIVFHNSQEQLEARFSYNK